MTKRTHAFYSGQVQGVGFRFTVQRIALDLKLSGWIRNLPDGRVEMAAEGEEGALKQLLDQIKTGFLEPHIQNETVTWETATEEFDGFNIRFR